MVTGGDLCRKLYPSLILHLLLVLIPQLLWVLSSPNGLPAVCESCSDLTYRQLLLMRPPATASRVSKNHTESATDLQADRNCASDDHLVQSGCQNSASLQAYATSDPNVSSRCVCSLEHSDSKVGYTDDMSGEDSGGNEIDGGWHIPHNLPSLAGPCNIQRRNSSLSQQEFLETFAYTEPVIITGLSDQSLFRTASSKYRLLRTYGQELITIATANTRSYHKVKMTLCEYIDRVMKPQTFHSLGNETLYHFGDNDREGWAELFSLYRLPPYDLPGLQPVLSFGLAGPGTGVPFHIHGPTFAETIYGRKRWFLYPPDHRPTFHPDITSLHWATFTLPQLPTEQKPMECTLQPGEILYFPDRWWHATLNVDTAVFMSTFYS